jgi:hypothetical protein
VRNFYPGRFKNCCGNCSLWRVVLHQMCHKIWRNDWRLSVVCADRTTLTNNRRLERVLEHLERDLQRGVEPGDVIPPYTTWHQHRRVASFDFRVSVYRENLWVNSLPIIGRPRDISPDHLRCVCAKLTKTNICLPSESDGFISAIVGKLAASYLCIFELGEL